MATIDEKINKMVRTRLQELMSKIGYNERISLEYFATDCSIEQDRIARQEERERCIKAAQDWYCNTVCVGRDNSRLCAGIHYCRSFKYIHQAMEGGDDGND